MSSSTPTAVFVVEKPAVARVLAPHLSARWPGHRIYAITTLYAGLYEFRYPRGLAIRDFPYVGEPAWKARSLELSPVWSIAGDKAARVELDPRAVLSAAEEISFAADPDPSGAVAFQVLLTEALGQAAAAMQRPAFQIHALDQPGIERAFDSPGTTADPAFATWVNIGTARRFFEFNFNVNALALLSQILRDVGVRQQSYGMSKYALQLLYGLRGRLPLSESEVIQLMVDWRGTTRYAPAPLGSPASRSEIVSRLLDLQLLAKDDHEGIALSSRGEAFLSLLHPDCEDADLPARLAAWALAWPDARPKMERYLRTFFGKLKRYAATRERLLAWYS